MDEQRHAVNTTDKYETEARQRYAQRADGERDTYIYDYIRIHTYVYTHTKGQIDPDTLRRQGRQT